MSMTRAQTDWILLTVLFAPLREGLPLVPLRHVQGIPEEGQWPGSRRKPTSGLLRQQAVYDEDREEESPGIQEGG